MNKEVIKKYKAEFDWWLDGGELLLKGELAWFNVTRTANWNVSDDDVYVINDQYVEFRKALAEGKTIQGLWKSCDGVSEWIETGEFINYEDYRIKPDEPKFKVGDLVRTKNGVLTFKVESVFDDRVSYHIKCKEDYQFKNRIELWTPRDGDVIVCWNNDEPNIAHIVTIGIPVFEYCDVNGDFRFDNVIPYIGQDFKDMK